MVRRLAARSSSSGGCKASKRRSERAVHVRARVRCSALERSLRPAEAEEAAAAVTTATVVTTRVELKASIDAAQPAEPPASVQTAPSAQGQERQKASKWRAGGGGIPLLRPRGAQKAATRGATQRAASSGHESGPRSGQQPHMRHNRRQFECTPWQADIGSGKVLRTGALLLPSKDRVEAKLLACSAAAPSTALDSSGLQSHTTKRTHFC